MQLTGYFFVDSFRIIFAVCFSQLTKVSESKPLHNKLVINGMLHVKSSDTKIHILHFYCIIIIFNSSGGKKNEQPRPS